MKLLLDTHILLWALLDDPALSDRHKHALMAADAELYVSAASVWEVAIKRAQGRLDVPETLFETARDAGCRPLPITWAHAQDAGQLPRHHADPFDRMLIAQARCEDLCLVTADRAFRPYAVTRL